jgi:uncharacterized membrane protein
VLVAIGIAAAILNLATLLKAPQAGPNPAMNVGVAAHPVLTLVHVPPGLLFMLLAPLQFVPTIRARVPRLHRWIGRLVVSLALVIGGSAFLMSFQKAIGGVNEMAAAVLFDLLFLFCPAKGYAAARRLDLGAYREWMIRMFGIGLGNRHDSSGHGDFFRDQPSHATDAP